MMKFLDARARRAFFLVPFAYFATAAISPADEADIDVTPWPNVTSWQERMRAQPGCAHPYEVMPQESRP